ncbi:RagB/SusD family nutrient uptake outer membrane protein [Proteiniphilum acetatigenes]|uniref:RagB/SusD family nutrient uptake outer membrane protein n=1 Tax=Proteiniphilum acetatigenes TaxID=294710 RepID=UPI00037D8BD0|nr:RagB/SusD family nutrient uptake outer membrane protein [Proteiniphilum acetatigenes]SFL61489.1 Starch-binding associating with outer membrane [Porphyromonadaceae bacterium KH3CP3RA]
MIQKYIYKIIAAFCFTCGLFILTSCENDTVDLMPVDRITDETAFDTPERCALAVTGMYDAIQSGYYPGNNARRGYPFGAASIIQSDMRGEDLVNMEAFYQITYEATHGTTSANNVAMWENSFAAINRINVVIEGINKAKENDIITADVADQYIGEAYFLRALTYSNLLIHFCLPYGVDGNNNYGLPYYEIAINTPERLEESLLIERSSLADTYAKILTDLDNAEDLLAPKHNVDAITRASSGAAIALKTRIYLWKKDWANVISEAKKIVPQSEAPFSSPIGDYKLADTPDVPFTNYTSNVESVFSVENSTDDNATVNGSLAQMMSNRTGGRGLIALSPILYNSTFWLEDDLRRNLILRSNNKYYADKYQRPQEQDEYAPIIRYAEVLLNYAEAELRSSDNTEMALKLLNAVRNRSVKEADRYTSSTFPTKKAMLEALLWERRIEFFAEGRRWEDIHRLINDTDFDSQGIPAKVDPKKLTAYDVYEIGKSTTSLIYKDPIPYTDRRFLWPISQDDIIRNPTLAKQQNAGW